MDWNIVFNEVYMSSNSEENKFIIYYNTSNSQETLKIDFGFILGTQKYRIFLKDLYSFKINNFNEIFFNKLIEENKYYKNKYRSKNKYKANYYLYTCNKAFESEIKTKFQSIKFISNVNYIFELCQYKRQ